MKRFVLIITMLLMATVCFAGETNKLDDRITTAFYVDFDYIGETPIPVSDDVLIFVKAGNTTYAVYYHVDKQTCEVRTSDYGDFIMNEDDIDEFVARVASYYSCSDCFPDTTKIYK